jgi:hypothetical protein
MVMRAYADIFFGIIISYDTFFCTLTSPYFFADVYEEVLEIVSYMTFFSPMISLDMWSLWPLMMEALNDWAIDFFESMLPLVQIYI